MRFYPFFGCMILVFAVAGPAFAVNEHHAASEAADRALIQKNEEKGIPTDPQLLNIPDPERNTVNTSGSNTQVGMTKRRVDSDDAQSRNTHGPR